MDVIRFMCASALPLGMVVAMELTGQAAVPQPLQRAAEWSQAIVPNAKAAAWPQTYYDSAHTSFNPHEKTLGPKNVSGLQLLGGANTGEGPMGFALDSGTLYVRTCCGSNDNLEAFDASSFAQKWATTVGNDGVPNRTVVVAGSRVFSGCQADWQDIGLCAYSTRTGKQLWSFLGSTPSGICDSFTYASGIVYVEICNGPSGSDVGVYALNATTGKPVWSHVTGNNSIIGPLAVSGGYVYYACSTDPHLYGAGICALKQTDGSLVWSNYRHEYASMSAASGVVYGNAVPGTEGGGSNEVFALDGATGSQLWSYVYNPVCCGTVQAPALAKGVVYAPTNGTITALSASTGTVRWSVPTKNYTAISVANGVVYDVEGYTPSNDLTTARRASDGTVLWTAAGCNCAYAAPIVANATVYSADPTSTCSVCAYGSSGMRVRAIPALRRSI